MDLWVKHSTFGQVRRISGQTWNPATGGQNPGRVVLTGPVVTAVNSLKLYVNISGIGINSCLSPEKLLIQDGHFGS